MRDRLIDSFIHSFTYSFVHSFITMLLVIRSLDLRNRKQLKHFIIMGFTSLFPSWSIFLSPLRGKKQNNVIVFILSFHIFILLTNLWFIGLQGQFPILKKVVAPYHCPLIRPPRSPLALKRENRYSGIHSALSLLLRGLRQNFFFNEDKTPWNFSQLSSTFRDTSQYSYINCVIE